MTDKVDPGAVARPEASGDQGHDEQLPDSTIDPSGLTPTEPLAAINSSGPEESVSAADHEDDAYNPFPGLVNMSPAEYESVRRWMARQRGWRVATLDRLYRQARRKAGLR